MSDRESVWEQTRWDEAEDGQVARAEWIFRGKPHKGDVRIFAQVMDPGTGKYKELDLGPPGDACTYSTWRVVIVREDGT